MKRNVSYDKQHRQLAQERRHALFTVEINGQTCQKDSITYQGPADPETAKKLTLFCILILEGQSPQQAMTKIKL